MAALGQISALNQLGLLGKIKYIGGISGGKKSSGSTTLEDALIYILWPFCSIGSWATIVVTYAQNINNVEKFLCPIIPPEEINPKILGMIDHECVRRFAADDLIEIALELLKERAADSVAEAWAGAVQVMYLGTLRSVANVIPRYP